MMMNMKTNKRRKAQSQTQIPTKNPHQDQQQEDQNYEETNNDHKPAILPYLRPLYYPKCSKSILSSLAALFARTGQRSSPP
ncbi:hypothetical protein LguiA_033462 [Lonicera macranthoides]